MKKCLFLIIITILFSGCWSSGKNEGNSLTNEKVNNNGSVKPGTNQEIKTNSKVVPYKGNVDPGRANKPDNQNMKVIKRDNENNKTKFEERKAPDNSTFKSTLGKDGAVETRTFQNHPQISKVVRTTKGNDRTLKVYLKNGKVYDMDPGKYPNFRNMHPGNILKAIGLEPKVPTEKQPSGKKKEEENNE